MFNYTGTYTDYYQLNMAQIYFLKGQANHTAIFDYFFRKRPLGNEYAIFAGLEDLLDILEHWHFDEADLRFLKQQGFHADFIKYLQNFRFKGTVSAPQEGSLLFPMCPVVTIEASLIEAQLIETVLLNCLNFQTLIATKAHRIRLAAGERRLIDFGLRRAQGLGGYYASRAAIIGGFDATSNTRAGRDYHLPVAGTMAHAFVQAYEDELTAFRHIAEINPEHCILLVDTYNTLQSGLPNAITVAKEMASRGQALKGIRLDSGDLISLSKAARHMLNEAGFPKISIIASDQLDEQVIQDLLAKGAPIDAFGVGTNLAIGKPDGALDGVYKLACIEDRPCIKLSENTSKITLPYKKQVYRLVNEEGLFSGTDVIALAYERQLQNKYYPFEALKPQAICSHPHEALLHPVMKHGKRLFATKGVKEIAFYAQQQLMRLPPAYKSLLHSEPYHVGLSPELKQQRDLLLENQRQKFTGAHS